MPALGNETIPLGNAPMKPSSSFHGHNKDLCYNPPLSNQQWEPLL